MFRFGIRKILLVLYFFLMIAGVFHSAAIHADEKPEIYAQIGHTNSVNAVVFSPDGRFALSGSTDKTVKLWDIASGREIKTFKGHRERVTTVAFSSDGRYGLSAAGYPDKTVRMWDISTGKEIKKFTIDASIINNVSMSPDGNTILVGTYSEISKLLETASGKEIRSFKNVYSSVSGSVTDISHDNRYLLTGKIGANIYDVSTGQEIRKFDGYFEYAAISPDGKYVVSAENSRKIITFWDVASGQRLRTLNNTWAHGIVFSPDGSQLLVNSSDLLLLDFRTGTEIWRLKRESGESFGALAFSPDGKNILTAGTINYENVTLKLLDSATGKLIRAMRGDIEPIRHMAISSDGKMALVDSRDGGGMQLWDINTGRQVRQKKIWRSFCSVAFSPDGSFYLSGDQDGSFRMWDISTGREIKSFVGHKRTVNSVAVSPSGKYSLSGSWDGTVKLWDIATGREVRTVANHPGTSITAAAFLPSGEKAISISENSVKISDIATGREERNIDIKSRGSALAVSPSGKYAAVFGSVSGWRAEYGISLIDINEGRVIKELGRRSDLPRNFAIAFSPDERYLLFGGDDQHLMLWDLEANSGAMMFSGHQNSITYVAFSADGKYAWSGSLDGTIRYWDVSSGKEIAQFVGFKDGEWIAITREGYYTSSVNGDKHLNVRIGNNVYGIDQYRTTFYKPQIVEAALKTGDTHKAIAEIIGDKKVEIAVQTTAPPFVVIKSPEDGKRISANNSELSVYIEDRNHLIKQVKVFINGRQMSAADSRGLKVKSAAIDATGIKIPEGSRVFDLKIPLTLDTGENIIEVLASNGYSESRKSTRIYYETPKSVTKTEVVLPNLWILSIGINKYRDHKISSLSYAASDADAIVAAFKKQKGKLFRDINSLIINDNSPIKPTADNILDNFNYVKKAGKNDIVIFFIAGHGINDDSGDYYFLPSDAAILDDGSVRRSKAISWREIKSLLDIPAKKIFFADTCHSEGIGGKKTRGVDNDRFVKELQEANAVVFTSSRGKELSQESDKWKHGAFTFAIIEGLKGKAELMKSGKITMKELDVYVSETVPKITNGAQHPITYTPDGYVNFPVAIIE